MNFLNTLNTKVYKNKAVRCRKYREEISALVLRKVFGSKVVDNVLNDISHGANINGIQTATTADILHVVKSGVVPKLLKVVYSQMSDTSLTAIDLHVGEFLSSTSNNRSGERNSSFPCISFWKEYTKLTELSGDEKFGQLFVLALLLRTKE